MRKQSVSLKVGIVKKSQVMRFYGSDILFCHIRRCDAIPTASYAAARKFAANIQTFRVTITGSRGGGLARLVLYCTLMAPAQALSPSPIMKIRVTMAVPLGDHLRRGELPPGEQGPILANNLGSQRRNRGFGTR